MGSPKSLRAVLWEPWMYPWISAFQEIRLPVLLKTPKFDSFLRTDSRKWITTKRQTTQQNVRRAETSRPEVSRQYKPPVTKRHVSVIEAFGCTLMKTHVFQWDTCNQMSSWLFHHKTTRDDKTMRLICVVEWLLPLFFFWLSHIPRCTLFPSVFVSLQSLFSFHLSKWASSEISV